jgi:hypothetical protein
MFLTLTSYKSQGRLRVRDGYTFEGYPKSGSPPCGQSQAPETRAQLVVLAQLE